MTCTPVSTTAPGPILPQTFYAGSSTPVTLPWGSYRFTAIPSLGAQFFRWSGDSGIDGMISDSVVSFLPDGATVNAQFLPCADPPPSERVLNIHAPDPDISMLDASQLYGPLAGGIDLGKGKGIIVGECADMDADPEYPAVGRCLTVGDNASPADLLFRQEQPDTDTWFSFRFSPDVPDTQFIGVHSRYVADNDRVMLRIHPNRIMIRNIHGIEYTYEKEYTFDRGCWYDVRMKTYGTEPYAGRMHVWVVRNPEATEVDWAEVNTPPTITTGASPLGTTSNQYTFIRFGGAAAHTANSMQIRFFRQRAYPSACAYPPDPLPMDTGGILEVTPSVEQTVVALAGESKEIVYTLKNTKTGLNTDGTIPRLDVSVSLLAPDAPFSVAGNSRYVLGPGQEQQVPVTFAPTVASTEPYTATVMFVSGYYSESRTISAYADDPDVAAADIRIAPTLVQFGYVPNNQYPWVERQITLYNYGDQAISGKAILPTEESLPFKIKKQDDANYPNPPIVDYTLPAATVAGETVDPGTQTFDVRLTQNFTSPQVYSRDILFTGWGGATCTVSASTVPGAVGSGSSTAVRINEFMLKNMRGLQDEFGRYVQWIEFYNTDMTQTVDLNGWQFTATDRYGVPATWTFPSATIAPGGYLVAMASDAAPPTQNLNTGFPLDEQEGAP